MEALEDKIKKFLAIDIGDGYGYGSGDGSGVKEVSGSIVYIVDNTPTIITSVRANVAQGFILQNDLQTIPCYIVKATNDSICFLRIGSH